MRGNKPVVAITAVFIILIPAMLRAAGRVDADFLRVEPSARTSALSGAFCGVADDLSAITFNPAGLVQVTRTAVSISHFSSFSDTNNEYISGAMRVGHGVAAMSLQCGYTFDFKYIDEFGDEGDNIQNYDMVAIGSYAVEVMPQVSLGANVKGFYSRLYLYSKAGLAADAGLFVKLAENPLTRAGIAIQNIGTQSAYISIADPLPSNAKAGISTRVYFPGLGTLLVAVDVNRLLGKDELPTLDMGLEAEIYKMLILRGGYGFRHDAATFAVGIGFLLDKIRVSYAFQPYDALGAAHRITIDYNF